MSDSIPPPTPQVTQFRWPTWFLGLGVVLPFGVILAEWFGRFCTATYFDPMPSLWHALLLLSVPTVNLVLYLALEGRIPVPAMLAAASGFTGAILLFYFVATWQIGLLSIVVSPLTLIFPPGFLLCLMGVTPLVCSFLWFLVNGKIKSLFPSRFTLRWLAGAALAVACLVLVEAPSVITMQVLKKAETREAQAMAEAVSTIRHWGTADELLELCYRADRMSLNQSPSLYLWYPRWQRFADEAPAPAVRTETVRELYFRVTGRPFNDLPPPARRLQNGFQSADDFPDLVWGAERAGEVVGARLKGLSLDESRQDWHLEPAARLAYGEWTMVFKNNRRDAQEARCQIQLPADAFVSRVTLWVDGQPQEAAFDAKAKVTAAYREVVRVQNRDPVLVNQVGPNRVMMQCFPVPPQGGTMKVRLGITVPVREAATRPLTLPILIERNFSLPDHLNHAVWIQSPASFELGSSGEKTTAHSGGYTWQKDLSPSQVRELRVRASLPEAATVWTEDPFTTTDQRFLIRSSATHPTKPLDHLVIVIDTSMSLAEHKSDILEAVRSLPAGVSWQALLPTDAASCIRADASHLESALGEVGFVGGRDNSYALVEAMRQSVPKGEQVAILWLHGPQPVSFTQTEKLLQQLERAPVHVPIHALELSPGPNRLLELLYRHHSLKSAPPCHSAGELKGVLHSLIKGESEAVHTYERISTAPTEGTRVSDQLARYWAFEQVMKEFRGASQVPEEMAKLASRYQLVTPYSGAVVLERKEQYDRAGLKQVDASAAPSIPSIPEPGTPMMLGMAALVLLFRRRRPAYAQQ